MAVDITIDAIIRRNLAKRRLPLHYYGPMLVMAKDGLEEMHFDSLQKVKYAVIDVDQDLMTADLPADYVEAVMVGVEIGDKVKPLGHNEMINKRDDEGVPFDQTADLYTYDMGYRVGHQIVEQIYNEYGGFKGRNFGRPVTFTNSYTILRDLGKIRIDNKAVIEQIHLIYLSMPEKVTNKSVIHPFAKKALEAFINWEWAIYAKERDVMMKRAEFFNWNRILRARLNKLTKTEIVRSVRNNIRMSIKN